MRLSSPVGLVAATWYPGPVQTADEAVASGILDQRTADDLGYECLPISTEVAPPDMAVAAARQAGRQGGEEQIGLLLHASVHHQGHDAWSAAHYVAHQLGHHQANPVALLQQCNGGAVGVELAARQVAADPDGAGALVTTGDRFLLPSWDRWRTDYGMAAGDVGTAVYLTPEALPHHDLVLHAIATVPAAELELMHRGDDPLAADPLGHGSPIDVKRTKRAYLRRCGLPHFVRHVDRAVRAVLTQVMADAGLRTDDRRLRVVALPRLGRKALEDAYLPPLVASVRAKPLNLGRRSGHIGAGDFIANLSEIAASDLLEDGELALVLNGGGGFTFTAAVVGRPASRPGVPSSNRRPSRPTGPLRDPMSGPPTTEGD
jgi:3-oxoacyl-[acyl-carrier-protein] synthase III